MRIKEIRRSKGLSIVKLGELAGMHRRTVQEAEKRGDCRVSTALRLADALGVTIGELCAPAQNP